MPDFINGKNLGAACIGIITAAVCYLAGIVDWHLIALPVLVLLAYYLIFDAAK